MSVEGPRLLRIEQDAGELGPARLRVRATAAQMITCTVPPSTLQAAPVT